MHPDKSNLTNSRNIGHYRNFPYVEKHTVTLVRIFSDYISSLLPQTPLVERMLLYIPSLLPTVRPPKIHQLLSQP